MLLAVIAQLAVVSDAPGLLRIPLAVLALMLLPGYALAAAIFPDRNGQEPAELLALSFGLSLALIAVVSLVWHSSPYGMLPTAAGLTMTAVTLAAAGVAARLRRGLPLQEPTLLLDLVRWPVGRATLAAGALVCALLSLGLWLVVFGPQPDLTEFYLVGANGLAERYPRSAVSGETIDVRFAVVNQRDHTFTYRIVALVDGSAVVETAPRSLAPEEQWEDSLSVPIRSAGGASALVFQLWRDADERPIRSLKLTLDVRSSAR